VSHKLTNDVHNDLLVLMGSSPISCVNLWADCSCADMIVRYPNITIAIEGICCRRIVLLFIMKERI